MPEVPAPVTLAEFSAHADLLVEQAAIEQGGEEYWVEGAGRNADHVERAGWILGALSPPRCRRVIEVGSAHGYYTAKLRAAGAYAVGVEASARWVDFATAKYGPWYFHALAEVFHPSPHILAGGLFDGLLLGEVLEHVLDPHPVLTRAEELCEAGARYVVTVPSAAYSLNEPDHRRFIGARALATMLLSRGWTISEHRSNAHFRYVTGCLP